MEPNPIAPYDGSVQQGFKTLDRFFGLLENQFEPWRLKRMAQAEASREKLLTSAKAESIIKIAEAESQREEQMALVRLRIKEWERQQENRAAVAQEAMKYLPPSLPEAVPDVDWINDFFHTVENISETQLRRVFAKILAGEVVTPRTFSRRALVIVREMGPDEVRRWKAACSLIWFLDLPEQSGGFIPGFLLDNARPDLLTSDDMILLEEAGLIRIHPGIRVQPPAGAVLRYGSHKFTVGPTPNLGIAAVFTTRAGDELYRVFDVQEDKDYLDRSLTFFKFPGNAVELSPVE